MRAADDLDQWITALAVDDPWVVAAAHAGDARAMRCVARSIRYAPSRDYLRLEKAAETRATVPDWASIHHRIAELTEHERARWYTMAARHGDGLAAAELAEDRQIAHAVQHWARWWAGNDPEHPAGRIKGPHFGLPGQGDPELCRRGARQGYASCMLRWADHLRGLGLEHRAEADRLLAQARQGKPDLPPSRDTVVHLRVDPATIVITAMVTSALLPFVQAMISKAGEDSYHGLRRYLQNVFHRNVRPGEKPHRQDTLLVVSPPPDESPPAALLQIWTDLPDEAIIALSQLVHDLRTIEPTDTDTDSGTERRWYWDSGARRWQRLRLPRPQPGSDDTGTGPPRLS